MCIWVHISWQNRTVERGWNQDLLDILVLRLVKQNIWSFLFRSKWMTKLLSLRSGSDRYLCNLLLSYPKLWQMAFTSSVLKGYEISTSTERFGVSRGPCCIRRCKSFVFITCTGWSQISCLLFSPITNMSPWHKDVSILAATHIFGITSTAASKCS